MHRWIFTYPVFVATGFLILHSWLFRGRRNTLIFWGLGYLIAFGRELVYQNFFPSYRFTGADFKLLNVPLTIPAGWLFESYISLYFAQYILGVDLSTLTEGASQMTPKRYGARVLPVITLACVVTGTIAYAIENVAVRMEWWRTRGGGESISPGWIPGHMFTVFWVVTLLLFITHPALRLRRNLAYVALALGFIGIVEMVEVIGRASGAHVWLIPMLAVVAIGYLASLFMYWRLLLFFVVFQLAVTGDSVAGLLAPLLGIPHDEVLVWEIWNMSLVLLYGLFIVKTRGPEPPIAPAQLL